MRVESGYQTIILDFGIFENIENWENPSKNLFQNILGKDVHKKRNICERTCAQKNICAKFQAAFLKTAEFCRF